MGLMVEVDWKTVDKFTQATLVDIIQQCDTEILQYKSCVKPRLDYVKENMRDAKRIRKAAVRVLKYCMIYTDFKALGIKE